MKVENIEIKRLEDVISLEDDKTITGYKIQSLTAGGENYGSLMLGVDIDIRTPRGNEQLKTVAKMVPPNEIIQKIFNTQVSFKNEIAFYKHIVPTLQNFQREQGMNKVIDCFPKYYGSRINLEDDDSAKVDSDAILLLENLKLSTFKNLDRFEGFDLDAAKLVVKDLAHFHAIPLALKLKKPDIFENKIKKYLCPMPHEDNGMDRIVNIIRNHLEQIGDCKPFMERMVKGMQKPLDTTAREPFATLTHNDLWVNNTMIKFESSVPFKNKIVDFQVCDYGSPATDLLFFLFSSVKIHVLEKYYDLLVKLYYNVFAKVLTDLKCETSQFSFEGFLKEMELEAKGWQFVHIIFMTFPIFAPKGVFKDVSEITPEAIFDPNRKVSKEQEQKLVYVVKEFAKRNWI